MPQNESVEPSREADHSRAHRLAEALASRLNKADDPTLSRMIIQSLAKQVGLEICFVDKG